MINSLSHKLKFLTVAFLSLLVGIVIYKREIIPTKERISQIEQLNQTSEEEKQLLQNQINTLLQKKAQMTKEQEEQKGGNFESFLIKEISEFDNKINVTSVSDIYTFQTNGFDIMTLQLTVKNDFKTILKLIDFIENEIKSIKIISVDYFAKKINYNSSKKNLYATLSFQTIQNS